MDAISLLAEMKKSFLDEGIVDEQFIILEELGGPKNPKFLQEMMNSYYKEANALIDSVADEIYEFCHPDVYKLENLLHQLKGKCESVGALRVKNAVDEMRLCLIDYNDYQICTSAISAVKEMQENLQTNLDKYFKLKEQVQNASTAEQKEIEEDDEDES